MGVPAFFYFNLIRIFILFANKPISVSVK